MGKVVKLVTDDNWKQRIENVRFAKRKLTLVTKEGQMEEYVFIVVENIVTGEFRVSGYSKYLFKKKMVNRRIKTRDYHAKVIVAFLNYIFFDKYDKFKLRSIVDLGIEHGNDFLRAHSHGEIGNKYKTKQCTIKAEQILNKFYEFITDECSECKKLIVKDAEEESLFSVVYRDTVPVERVKYLPIDILVEILNVCDIYYPELKFAICLQAFGGLRMGEVCNVSKDKITYEMTGKEFSSFIINLKEKTQMRSDGVNVGNIKKRRKQPIHPVFLPILTKVYNNHMKLIDKKYNPYQAVFLNRYNEAMTDDSYDQKFERIIRLLIKRLSSKGDFNSLSNLNILTGGRVNTHIFRHFFSQFIALIDSPNTPHEIAYWRGDSSLDSALPYLQYSPEINEKLMTIQAELLHGI